MQPTATASIPPTPPPNAPGDMDAAATTTTTITNNTVGAGGAPPGTPATAATGNNVQAMQSMDWLFKKERFYLLVQFWQQRATLAEKEVTTLKEQIANNTANNCENKEGTGNNNMLLERVSFESEIAAKDKEINQLVEEVQRLQTTVSKLKETSITQISRLEEQLEQKRLHIIRLETKLDLQGDYEDLKRELGILRPDLSSSTNSEVKSLEFLLEKSKQHQRQENSENTAKTPTQEVEDGAAGAVPPAAPQGLGLALGLPLPQQPAQQQQQQQQPSSKPATPPGRPDSVHTEKSRTPASTPQPCENHCSNASQPPQRSPSVGMVIGLSGDVQQQQQQQQQQLQQQSLSQPLPAMLMMNGNPKSPTEDNNNHHLSNNNIPISAATMCAVNSFLRGEETLKSPYRFDEHHRSPFRFAEDLGMAPGSMVGRLGESLIPKGDPMEAKLQEMLRYNMDKYASQNLDTLHISRRVRELLSIHNIGQRLFAKYILGLSQGTVSELLSKPKPWDKLTEKGRDSYRKMHAWACDEQAILLLKSLIPKKGKDTGIAPFPGNGGAGGRPENDLTEERIAHILSEASQFQQIKGHSHSAAEDSRSNDDSKSPHGQCLSPFSKDSSQNRRLKKYENDDIPQEKVVRIYQEELAKLMGRRMEDMRNPRDHFPAGMFFPQLFSAGGQMMDRTQDEIRMALDAYHREIMKLNQTQNPGQPMPNLGLLALQQQALAAQQHHQQQQQQAQQQQQQQQQQMPSSNGGAQDLSLPKDNNNKLKTVNGQDEKDHIKEEDPSLRHSGSAFSLVRPKIEPGSQTSGGSTASSPLGNAILPPAMTPSDEFSGSTVASPLQRMASITNSLISQPPSQPHHTSSQRPLKAVLPPITQQQFDQYNNLNTEDIVKKVKEQLSQYSISQRLFGESVLGLSQGSVSDLLARPKPWHMLTQKGREPFIRMKMFLEDDNAVHKLVASQYKIAPEKLMRTGGYGGAGGTMGKPMPPTTKMLNDAAGLISKMQETQNLLPPSLQLGPPPPNQNPPPPPPMLLTPPGVPPHHAISLQQPPEHLKKQQTTPSSHGGGPTGGGGGIPHSPIMAQHQVTLRNMHQHMSPSVYEMAALTQDLDTQVITTKIKEALLANNIGQKIFGEAVLGLSQGSVSELLSKPKPWHMLSIKGREPFIRMQLWLNDAHNIDRLQALKNERREANKRRRSSGGPGAHDNSSDTSSNDTSEFYHSNSPGPGPTSAKKQRVLFSEEQKEALRLAFALDPYPNVATIEFLASELGLSSRTITNWFHNHRMRLKQQVPHGIASDIPPRDQTQGGQGPFDPVQFRLLLNQRLLELSKERMGLNAGTIGGVPLPYPPYLTANTNLAALISRGLLPTADLDLSALNNAVKEQMSGLDLSLKREPGDYDDEDDDMESNAGSEDSNMSTGSLQHQGGNLKTSEHHKDQPVTNQGGGHHQGRSSRRKPVAPQWVNPDWQDDTKEKVQTGDEVIINGVCVMQTEDYAGRRSSEETVRVEPTPVLDRFVDDDQSDASSISNDQDESPLHHHHHLDNKSGDKDESGGDGPKDDILDEDLEDEEPSSHHHQSIIEQSANNSDKQLLGKDETEDERWDY